MNSKSPAERVSTMHCQAEYDVSFAREQNMSESVDALILDLLDWIGPRDRPYAEVMAAWRTSCPRLPVWEEANEKGFIEHHIREGRTASISVSRSGREHLRQARATGLHS